MRGDIEKILDECIDRMNAGESLDDCLANYPEHSKELRPLLTAAFGIHDACSPIPGPGAKALGRRKLQAALAGKRNEVGFMRRIFEALSVQRTRVLATVSIILVAVVVGLSVGLTVDTGGGGSYLGLSSTTTWQGMKNFVSVADFQSYVANANAVYTNSYGSNVWGISGNTEPVPAPAFSGLYASVYSSDAAGGGTTINRVSDTNVQVVGIDEPDVLKMNGKQIYFSPEEMYYYYALDSMPPQMTSTIKVINAFPAANLSLASNISDMSGDMLLYNNTLVIFSGNSIYGYDVSDPQNPVSKWSMNLSDNTYLSEARLCNGKIYLVTQTGVDTVEPYYSPVTVGGVPLRIQCVDIYYPVVPVSVDVTYTAMVCDPQTGDIENTVSFVGSSSSSVIYMSENAIYVAYSYDQNVRQFYFDFYTGECQDIFPASVIDRLSAVDAYDLSDEAKLTELSVVTDKYLGTLTSDGRSKAESEISDRLGKYYDNHKREIVKTGIVKIGLDGFQIASTGTVPGTLLNQFSMDEYNGSLRVATTVAGNFGMFWGMGTSVNDVYVLDSNLQITGSIQGLGLTESIYSARFIGDKGYLVTYLQTDPLYVLDLSDPQNPQLKGELKIAGYSSYLHPISETRMLGIGEENAQTNDEENWEVKISLFDVADAANPSEMDKYVLNDSWSEVLNNHHAFLLDSEHEIFFLPGSNGGYIFSYAGDKLTLVKSVSDIQAKRAVYINDYLYIVGDNKVVVLDESDWTTVSQLEF
jgi:uncharacterized secreted protein with C-terminal beta-propeller domain